MTSTHQGATTRRQASFAKQAADETKLVFSKLGRILVSLCTFPYYRFYHFNTLDPIVRIASYTNRADGLGSLVLLLTRWRSRKISELQFISVACAIIAAAVIGSFSWNSVADAYWLASALWYGCLVLSALGIMISAQQIAVLNILDTIPRKAESAAEIDSIRRTLPLLLSEVQPPPIVDEGQSEVNSIGIWRPKWKMVFLWQCPQMFMSYSFILYLAGLLLLVCTPLIKGQKWGPESNIAVIFLAMFGFAGASFLLCSYWIYHYVDLEHYDSLIPERDLHDDRVTGHANFVSDGGFTDFAMAIGR